MGFSGACLRSGYGRWLSSMRSAADKDSAVADSWVTSVHGVGSLTGIAGSKKSPIPSKKVWREGRLI